jgi:hypothetical protein
LSLAPIYTRNPPRLNLRRVSEQLFPLGGGGSQAPSPSLHPGTIPRLNLRRVQRSNILCSPRGRRLRREIPFSSIIQRISSTPQSSPSSEQKKTRNKMTLVCPPQGSQITKYIPFISLSRDSSPTQSSLRPDQIFRQFAPTPGPPLGRRIARSSPSILLQGLFPAPIFAEFKATSPLWKADLQFHQNFPRPDLHRVQRSSCFP